MHYIHSFNGVLLKYQQMRVYARISLNLCFI